METEELQSTLREGRILRIKEVIKKQREPLLVDFRAGKMTGIELASRLSALTDSQIVTFAEHYLAPFQEEIALVLTGGSGRGQSCPHSDIDLLTIVPETLPAGFEESYSAFYMALVDAGYEKPGLSIRTPDECVQNALNDQTIWTSLLDRRFLWGRQEHHLLTDTKMDALISRAGGRLLEKIWEDRETRWNKMGLSHYLLHPNVKEGRGGLRDYHLLLWTANILFREGRVGALAEHGIITPQELVQVEDAHAFETETRCRLHDLAKRPHEVLDADSLTELVSLHNAAHSDKSPETVESFMRTYYGHIRELGFATSVLADSLAKHAYSLSSLAESFSTCGSSVTKKQVPLTQENLGWADLMNIFITASHQEKILDPLTLRTIKNSVLELKETDEMEQKKASASLKFILSGGDHTSDLLRQMHETGLLPALIPAFHHIDRHMQFDPYHEHTVDEHSFRAVGKLRDIENGVHANDIPDADFLFSTMSEQDRLALYAAILFHDTGKGRGGEHEKKGALIAQETCPKLGIDAETSSLVSWLIRHHLVMSHTALHSDIEDPKTMALFCNTMPSERHLGLLYLLTAADIMATGQGRWNAHKATSLSDLHDGAKFFLRENELRKAPQTSLPDDYQIGETRINISTDEKRHMTAITVITPDASGLVERVAGTIALLGGDIVDARIETKQEEIPTAMDRFLVVNSAKLPYEKEYHAMIEERLRKAIEQKETPNFSEHFNNLAKKQNKYRAYGVKPTVGINNAVCSNSTAIAISTRDRPGLLYELAKAFNELNLELCRARVCVYGHIATDRFYVQDRGTGEKVAPQRIHVIRAALRHNDALTP